MLWDRIRKAWTATGSRLTRSRELPPWSEGPWVEAGQVTCESGQLILTDPSEFPTVDPSCGLVIDAPVGTHRLELQEFLLPGGYGLCVIRARVVWRGIETAELRCVGSIGVDLGMISIADRGLTEQALAQFADEEFEAAGLLGNDNYDLIDPAEDGNCFLHVFRSGMGDGDYPVFAIQTGNQTSGILIDMTGQVNSDGGRDSEREQS